MMMVICPRCMERYNEEKNQWETVACMSTERCGVGACVLEGRLYVVGVCVSDSLVERYDEEKDKWDVIADLMSATLTSLMGVVVKHELCKISSSKPSVLFPGGSVKLP